MQQSSSASHRDFGVEFRDIDQRGEEPQVFEVVLLGVLAVAIPYLMLLASFWYFSGGAAW